LEEVTYEIHLDPPLLAKSRHIDSLIIQSGVGDDDSPVQPSTSKVTKIPIPMASTQRRKFLTCNENHKKLLIEMRRQLSEDDEQLIAMVKENYRDGAYRYDPIEINR
jgi:hypothetical protein